MKTFQQFLEESKEKKLIKKLSKKIEKRVAKDVKRQQKEHPDRLARMDYGHSEPNSIERLASIMAMERTASKWRKKMKAKQLKAQQNQEES
jgi:hypothetical protein